MPHFHWRSLECSILKDLAILQADGEALDGAEDPQDLTPAKSHTGESGLIDLASTDSTGCDGGDSVGDLNGSSQMPKLNSGGMSRSPSWQRGISKRNKIRPRQRVSPSCTIGPYL